MREGRRSIGMTILAAAAGFAVATLPTPREATALSYTLNTVFNGVGPTSAPPWLIATFTNNGVNTVKLTLTSSLEVASEFVDDVTFNVNPSIIPSSLTIIETSNVGSAPVTAINKGAQNAQNVQGGGVAGNGFDIEIVFDNAPPVNRFNGSDVAEFTITGAGITESDFAFLSTGSAAAHVGAHIQGIPGTGGTTSGAIKDGLDNTQVVPEPGTWLLLSTGCALLLGYGWRKRHAAPASM